MSWSSLLPLVWKCDDPWRATPRVHDDDQHVRATVVRPLGFAQRIVVLLVRYAEGEVESDFGIGSERDFLGADLAVHGVGGEVAPDHPAFGALCWGGINHLDFHGRNLVGGIAGFGAAFQSSEPFVHAARIQAWKCDA